MVNKKSTLGLAVLSALLLAGCDSGGNADSQKQIDGLNQQVASLEKQLSEAKAGSAQAPAPSAQGANTLDRVKNAGVISCGVSTGLPGFSNPNSNGEWEGIDVEFCQAMAAAVLGDKSKVKFVPLTAKERFTALQSGEIDVLSRNTTWTLQRDGTLGLNFVGVNYYDGQGFMVKKDLGVESALDLDGASVCVQSGTTTELNLSDYFRSNGMSFKPVVYDTYDATVKGFESGRCDTLTTDQSGLYASRIKLADPTSAVVLPEIISKEPLGPVVRQGDDNWFNIAKWTLNTMINGEEFNITSANVDEMKNSKDPNIRRILGLDGPKGKGLGLNDDWGYQVIKQVGNYDESFQRTVGTGSPLNIQRGVNALWSNGGILYAPPIR
ncbi:amino acid ABC transporter substrate-binding protein [Enterovibrio norvegicus]|uniref:Amino acid ABC transporter substrate-binding protein n=2 Tax=Enterovibrio norvegicus TaxID=188144 RepID=A0A2N7LFN5_9GAMM|nr:amino acid ABC transporter substrate-binding protein [Enterovibrio norvegicus]MCC4796717.1 amino acid ABC transporter substrate-binding protein [Enterovibrio norvegicus]OEE65389.1 amino acid ABC transporter substrate-binding protein [Enterovibrio norvegicus]OEF55536.1 amino acid ABC transporter substrate-binding protein [Enterovibrio norvegicus]OEF60001.1 amino acid ABC transporter substrate-binding protein [Enterovibrio norvegicus]PMH62707.1 amino acid ABC transporter substrate-binding pro